MVVELSDRNILLVGQQQTRDEGKRKRHHRMAMQKGCIDSSALKKRLERCLLDERSRNVCERCLPSLNFSRTPGTRQYLVDSLEGLLPVETGLSRSTRAA